MACVGPQSSGCPPKFKAAAGPEIVATETRTVRAIGVAVRGGAVALSDAAVAPVLAIGCVLFCGSPADGYIPVEHRPLANTGKMT